MIDDDNSDWCSHRCNIKSICCHRAVNTTQKRLTSGSLPCSSDWVWFRLNKRIQKYFNFKHYSFIKRSQIQCRGSVYSLQLDCVSFQRELVLGNGSPICVLGLWPPIMHSALTLGKTFGNPFVTQKKKLEKKLALSFWWNLCTSPTSEHFSFKIWHV